MSEQRAADPVVLPPIFPSSVIDVTNARAAVLVWTMTGRARVTVPDAEFDLRAGHAVWIGPGIAHSIETERDTVTFPIFFAAGPTLLPQESVSRVVIPRAWQDWLIWKFARDRRYLRTGPQNFDWMTELFPGAGEARGPLSLLLPVSAEAREIADEFLGSPAGTLSIEQLAERVSLSPRTLRRRFLTETGLNVRRWRQRARIAVAIDLLLRGMGIGEAGRVIGMSSPSTFTRAFISQTGATPRDFVRALDQRADGEFPGAGDFVEEVDRLVIGKKDHRLPVPPPIPALQTWERVSAFHAIVWMYRGSGVVDVGGQELHLHRGDAVWIPAGQRAQFDLDAGSVLLPLLRYRATEQRPEQAKPRSYRFARQHEHFLLHASVANNTMLRPRRYDELWIVSVFHPSHAGASSPATGAGAAQRLADALERDPSDQRTLQQWADLLRRDRAELHSEFIALTGDTFRRWRSRLRMTRARELLNLGGTPSGVARALGYSHLPAFSAAFKDAHGVSPREYRRAVGE